MRWAGYDDRKWLCRAGAVPPPREQRGTFVLIYLEVTLEWVVFFPSWVDSEDSADGLPGPRWTPDINQLEPERSRRGCSICATASIMPHKLVWKGVYLREA